MMTNSMFKLDVMPTSITVFINSCIRNVYWSLLKLTFHLLFITPELGIKYIVCINVCMHGFAFFLSVSHH